MENAGFEREDPRACCSSGSSSTVEMGDIQQQQAPPAEPPPSSPSKARHAPLALNLTPTPLAAAAPPVSVNVNGNGMAVCSEHCQSLHLQHQKYYQDKSDPPPPESPWHHLKTIFLVGTIIFLVLWIVVYTLLSQFSVL